MRKHFITVLHAQNRKDLLEYLETLFLSISQKKNSEYLSLVIHEIFVVYHVYFHIPENLAQPVTEFSASILDTEHSLENLKMKSCFTDCSAFRKWRPFRQISRSAAGSWSISEIIIQMLPFPFLRWLRIFSCILPTWEACLKKYSIPLCFSTFPMSGSALLRSF